MQLFKCERTACMAVHAAWPGAEGTGSTGTVLSFCSPRTILRRQQPTFEGIFGSQETEPSRIKMDMSSSWGGQMTSLTPAGELGSGLRSNLGPYSDDSRPWVWPRGCAQSSLTGGFFSRYRIGPGEVENALMEHPTVVEMAVISSPDPIQGEVTGSSRLGVQIWETRAQSMMVKSMYSGNWTA